MESAPLIEANNLSKCYHLWQRPADRLQAGAMKAFARSPLCPKAVGQRLTDRAMKLSRPFYALHDISFTLNPGESVGIIGRNGSGKSTLLQILAGTLTPTSGTFQIRGRIAALLELGSGFNPEFTGRENVFLQAALAGIGRSAAAAQFDEVAEFAGIGDFIEQPVKTYSSGMMVRLAFATQTILRPEIFIVDEALAVGDIFFQAKCARFFKQRLAEGMSLLFVSHDLNSVKALCRRTLVLKEGRAAFFGPSAAAVSHFHSLHAKLSSAASDAAVAGSPLRSAPVTLPAGARLRNWAATTEIGSKEAELVYCRVRDLQGNEASTFLVGESFSVEIFVQCHRAIEHVQFSVEISDRHSRVVYGVSSIHLGLDYQALTEGEIFVYRVSFSGRLGAGDYLVDAALGMGDRGDGAPEQHVHRVAQIAHVSLRHGQATPAFFGPADLAASMELALPISATQH